MIGNGEARAYGPRKFGREVGLRDDTTLYEWPINLIFNQGGMGDFVCYSAATTWLAKHAPWLHGRIFCPRYLVPLMKEIHESFPHWLVHPSEDFTRYIEPNTAMIGPSIIIDGVNTSRQLLNVLGAHPVDVGFAYYAHTTPAPPDGLLPVVDMRRTRLKQEVAKLDKPYVVIPCGNTSPARLTTGRHLNPIIEHIVARGMVPVFLGKTDLLGDGKKSTDFPDDIRYDLGLDLRDQTNVKEAACIMQHAVCTVGVDCGLLHVAALMKDSRIIFGYNITTVAHREPRRDHGKTIHITLTEDELKCIGCQSKLKQIAVHKFNLCLYGDTKCIDLMFKDGSQRWIDAIDEMVALTSPPSPHLSGTVGPEPTRPHSFSRDDRDQRSRPTP